MVKNGWYLATFYLATNLDIVTFKADASLSELLIATMSAYTVAKSSLALTYFFVGWLSNKLKAANDVARQSFSVAQTDAPYGGELS